MENMLLTGAYGFLGRNIRPFLSSVYSLSKLGWNELNDYKVDLSKEIPCLRESFDLVVHTAGKAHFTPATSQENMDFYRMNVEGTKNLCKALERTGLPRSFIFISSVSVYGCDHGENITEEYPLKGKSSYAWSKIQAELFLREWCEDHQVVLGVLRPALIVGKNPPGNLELMIRMLKNRIYYKMNRPPRKSMVLAEDIARIIPVLSVKGGVYNLCDTYAPTFTELEDRIAEILGKKPYLTVSDLFMNILARMGDYSGKLFSFDSEKLKKLQNTLTFSNEKVRKELDWVPSDVLKDMKL